MAALVISAELKYLQGGHCKLLPTCYQSLQGYNDTNTKYKEQLL
jgi:hypothetical protein